MAVLRAVLLDWRGTLAVTMTNIRWVEQAFRRLGRVAFADETRQVADALQDAERGQELAPAWERVDCDAAFHRQTYHRLFAAAGL